MRLGAPACLLTFALVLAPQAQCQQPTSELRIKLDSDGAPVSGALVALLDRKDSVIAEGLSTTGGERTLRAPPGTYRVRVRRIGYRPFVSGEVTLPRDGELTLNVETARVVLDAIVVNSKSQCKRNDPDARSLATVWDEIDKALRSSQLTLADLEGIGTARTYRKEVASNGAVITADTNVFLIGDRRPFGAIEPATLAKEGYVVGDEQKGWNYFAPDEVVLLSDEFAATHCFRLVREPDRPELIGVAFEPAPQRKLADITGVLWVDEQTSELREVVFSFANAKALSRFDAGGFTHFRRMPSGAWIVDDWNLSVPRLELRQGRGFAPQLAVIGRLDNGGGIVELTLPATTSAGSGVISGVVYDSITDAPLAGAIVSVDGAVARSDRAGRFELGGVAYGPHLVSFTHPALSAIGYLTLERELDVAADMQEIGLATPSRKTIWLRLCKDATRGADARTAGLVHGFVRDEDGRPANDVSVRLSWEDATAQPGTATSTRHLPIVTTTDDAGHYAACGFQRSARGMVTANSAGEASDVRSFTFESSPVVRRDLTLFAERGSRDSSARKELTVTVVDSAEHRPLADATVFVEGTTTTSRTDDAGAAILHPATSPVTVHARRTGFSEQTASVRLGTARRLRVVIALPAILPDPRAQ